MARTRSFARSSLNAEQSSLPIRARLCRLEGEGSFTMRMSRIGCLISIVISVVLSVILTVILNLVI